MFRKTVYGTAFKDVNFVPLHSATFCVQCELISNNSKSYCLACGSQALLGLRAVWADSVPHKRPRNLIPKVNLTI